MRTAHLFKFISALLISQLIVACKVGTTGPQTPNPNATQELPANNQGRPFTAEGTVSGGGGNGINGRTVESYAKQIEELPEYRRYISPILRKMTQGKPDVLLVYLNWAAKHKAWYFVPVELPLLPKSRTQLAFESDQLALHSEKEIFIYETEYLEKPMKERANLLLHEMVMAARLLMKQPPLVQCKTLSQANTNLCKNPKFAKAIQNPEDYDFPENERRILNGIDHEAVRAMTVFLMQHEQDLSGASVAHARQRMQFNFPWDQALSYLQPSDVSQALLRTFVAGSPEASPKNETSDESHAGKTCSAALFGITEAIDYNTGSLLLSLTLYQASPSSSSGTASTESLGFPLGNIHMESTGILDPHGSENYVDLVEILPSYESLQPETYHSYLLQLYITREEAPRVSEIKLIPVQILGLKASSGHLIEREIIRLNNVPSMKCIITPPNEN